MGKTNDPTITLSNGRKVKKSQYVEAKTKDLRAFGYSNLTEEEVSKQVDKILAQDKDLDVIGMFCESDILIEEDQENG